MKKTNIISEIKRIQELMGFENIISEAPVTDPITPLEKILYKFLPEFISDAKFTVDRNVYKINDEIIPKQDWENLNRFKLNPSSIANELPTLPLSAKNILISLFIKNPDFQRESLTMYKEELEKLLTQLRQVDPDVKWSETIIYNDMLQKIKAGNKSFDEALSEAWGLPQDNLLLNFLKGTAQKRYANYVAGKLSDEVKLLDTTFKNSLEKALQQSKADPKMGLSTTRQLLASKYTISNLIRKFLLEKIDEFNLAKEPEKFITNVGTEILNIVQKQFDNLTYTDISKVKVKLGTEIRSIASRMNVLGKKAGVYENSGLYSEITKLLKKEHPELEGPIDELMKVVKEVDPFNPNNEGIFKSWIWQFLNKTASANYFKNQIEAAKVWNYFNKEVKMRKCYDAETDEFIEKEMSGSDWTIYNFKQYLERTAMIAVTGVPKTLKEIQWDRKTYGVFSFAIIYWLSYHIGKPIAETIESIPYHMTNITFFNEVPFSNWGEYFTKVMNEKAKKVFIAKESNTALSTLTSDNELTNGILNTIMTLDPLVWFTLPFRPEVPQVITGALSLSEKLINGEAKNALGEANQQMQQYADSLSMRYQQRRDSINIDLRKTQQAFEDSLAKWNERYRQAEQELKNQITDSELGCRAFLKDNYKKFENGYCESVDGKKYYYENGTFVQQQP